MNCSKCGKPIPDNAGFCPECGQAVSVSDTPAEMFIPSLKDLKCPLCGSGNFSVIGVKGALGKAVATGAAFGAIGSLVAGSNAAKDTATQPLQYKCNDCKNKFVSTPLAAAAVDILPVPCTVTFERLSGIVGAAVPQIVYINGMKAGAVKNGKSITFQTYGKYNVMFVTDQYGVAFKSDYKFEAQPGGSVLVRFKGKFI
jgi:Zn finger protein HypA/HybF involved in hydrogenase expression